MILSILSYFILLYSKMKGGVTMVAINKNKKILEISKVYLAVHFLL